MLQRTVQPSLSRVTGLSTAEACHQCICRCGATFKPTATPFSGSAGRAFAAKAPVTRSRESREKRLAATAELTRLQATIHDKRSQLRRMITHQAQQKGYISLASDAVDDFLNRFAALCGKSRVMRRDAVDVSHFKSLLSEFGASEGDAMYMALLWLRDGESEQNRMYGQRLLFSLSAIGYAEASIRIVNHALLQSQTNSTVLRSSLIATVRGQLHKIVREGNNYRAMVLEGKVAYKLGDEEHAIKLWWQAMEACEKLGAEEKAQRDAGKKPSTGSVKDLFELSTPWVELIESHFDRSTTKNKDEWQQCEKAINIGLEQDDPTAFYYAATYYKERHPDGTHLPTSRWLWYMTKAAVSGVPKACHELGVFYAESGWKYIEDEPPEHVKPTAFDSYPGRSPGQTSFMQNLVAFFRPAPPALSEQDGLFHSAAFPCTPEHRLKLARHWLQTAISYTYAPSYLYLAKLYLQPTLWAGAAAPATALDLSPERYDYTSAEEKHDAEFSGQEKVYTLPESAQDPANPIFDEEKAKLALGRIFHANSAVQTRLATLATAAGRRRFTRDGGGATRTPLSEEDFATAQWKEARDAGNIRDREMVRFYENMDVFYMWEPEAEALVKEAARILDEKEWDLWDEQGRLLYRRGVGMVERQARPMVWDG